MTVPELCKKGCTLQLHKVVMNLSEICSHQTGGALQRAAAAEAQPFRQSQMSTAHGAGARGDRNAPPVLCEGASRPTVHGSECELCKVAVQDTGPWRPGHHVPVGS